MKINSSRAFASVMQQRPPTQPRSGLEFFLFVLQTVLVLSAGLLFLWLARDQRGFWRAVERYRLPQFCARHRRPLGAVGGVLLLTTGVAMSMRG
jgi:hypothetical protein